MKTERKIQVVAKVASHNEAEELDIEYYANIDWKESVDTVEQLRKLFWNKEYRMKKEFFSGIRPLNSDADDYE
jgi:hypothetical protein